MTPGVLLSSVNRKALWLAAAAASVGFVLDARIGAGVACGAALGILLLQSQAKIIGMCAVPGAKRWKRRLVYLWLLKYPALLTGLFLLVNPPIGGHLINLPGFAVGLGLVPAALLVHALTAR